MVNDVLVNDALEDDVLVDDKHVDGALANYMMMNNVHPDDTLCINAQSKNVSRSAQFLLDTTDDDI